MLSASVKWLVWFTCGGQVWVLYSSHSSQQSKWTNRTRTHSPKQFWRCSSVSPDTSNNSSNSLFIFNLWKKQENNFLLWSCFCFVRAHRSQTSQLQSSFHQHRVQQHTWTQVQTAERSPTHLVLRESTQTQFLSLWKMWSSSVWSRSVFWFEVLPSGSKVDLWSQPELFTAVCCWKLSKLKIILDFVSVLSFVSIYGVF